MGDVLIGESESSLLGIYCFGTTIDLADELEIPPFLFSDELQLIGGPRTREIKRDLERKGKWYVQWHLPLRHS